MVNNYDPMKGMFLPSIGDFLTNPQSRATFVAQVDRFSVTMPPDLGANVRQAAARQGTSVSTWLSEAAADKILFGPGLLPTGIEAADPMLKIRDTAYFISSRDRQ